VFDQNGEVISFSINENGRKDKKLLPPIHESKKYSPNQKVFSL
jgi:hypothetical protein